MGGLFKLSSSSHLFASVWGGQEESKEGESGLESFPFWYKRRPEGKRGEEGYFSNRAQQNSFSQMWNKNTSDMTSH